MSMLAAIFLSMVLSATVTWLYFKAMRQLQQRCLHTTRIRELGWVVAVNAIIGIHLLCGFIYAIGFWIGSEILEIGSFSHAPIMLAMDYFYFAIVTMTTLGIGDIFPTGHLRFVTGVAALNGFLLIGSSAAAVFSLSRRELSFTRGPSEKLADREYGR
ncbi:MAG: ion channel [Alphaproteobacteria bacterium]